MGAGDQDEDITCQDDERRCPGAVAAPEEQDTPSPHSSLGAAAARTPGHVSTVQALGPVRVPGKPSFTAKCEAGEQVWGAGGTVQACPPPAGHWPCRVRRGQLSATKSCASP